MLLGILLGVLTLLVVTVLALFVLGPLFPEAWLFGLPLFFLAYLIVAIVLVARPQTSSLGGGLLIGLGVFVLVGGGACFGLLFVSFGSMA